METTVKTYGSAKDYKRGLLEMQAQGWESINVTEKTRPRGCLSIFPAGSDLIVTYQRAAVNVPIAEVRVHSGACPNCGAAIGEKAFYCPSCRIQVRR